MPDCLGEGIRPYPNSSCKNVRTSQRWHAMHIFERKLSKNCYTNHSNPTTQSSRLQLTQAVISIILINPMALLHMSIETNFSWSKLWVHTEKEPISQWPFELIILDKGANLHDWYIRDEIFAALHFSFYHWFQAMERLLWILFLGGFFSNSINQI